MKLLRRLLCLFGYHRPEVVRIGAFRMRGKCRVCGKLRLHHPCGQPAGDENKKTLSRIGWMRLLALLIIFYRRH
jgi:hypothetical protein